MKSGSGDGKPNTASPAPSSLLRMATRVPTGEGERQRETQHVLRNIYVCYFLSGGLGLIYQILWLRKLLLVFGSTVHAVSTVLTVFFAGLALGSWLFGKLIDRREMAGLRWYAALEAIVGLLAFATLPLFNAIQHVYIPIYRASGFSPAVLVGASFACSALILLPPTTLLGGTFPVLSRFLIRSSEGRGVKIANIYAINTAGAMTGTLLVYYIGLPILGLSRTLACAGVLNLGIGLLCWTFDRHLQALGFHTAPTAATSQPVGVAEESPAFIQWLSWAFALSGFSAMVYEVAWTRTLSLVLGSSIYAFCIILATFLAGIALGSMWVRRDLRDGGATVGGFIRLELLLGVYGFVSIPLFNQLPEWFVVLWPITARSFTGLSLLQFFLSAFIILVPTLIMGSLFPVVSDLVTRRFATLGRRLGGIYAVNTIGGIVGSFLSGFVLIPWLGLPWAIIAAAVVNLAAGAVMYVGFGQQPSRQARLVLSAGMLVGAVLLGKFAAVPAWQRQVFAAGVYLNPESYAQVSVRQGNAQTKLLFYRDSLNATVSVHQSGETIFLKVGGKTDASNGIDMGTQVLSAHLPLLLHRDPKSVLVIGLGSGVTLGHAGRYPLTTIHCAELDPAVIQGARFFRQYNFGIHDDPRTTIFPTDGRNFLLASARQYDVIISEPSNPWMAGLAYLFTSEFYELAKRRLAPGGVMCQWLQLYRIFPNDVKMMLKTFHEAFPHMSVWSSITGDVLLVGTMEPQQVDMARLAQRFAQPGVKEALQAVKIDRPEVLLQTYWLGDREVEQLTADVPWAHHDDQPLVEFDAPKALYAGSTLPVNYEGLERFKSTPNAIAPSYDATREDAGFFRALAAYWQYRGEGDRAKEALEKVVEMDPAASEAWRTLGQLRLKRQEFFKAEQALMRAYELAPADAETIHLLGRLFWQQKRFADATRWYERAASLRAPDSEDAEEVGDCFRQDKQNVWAAEYYRSSIAQGGGDRFALVLEYGKVLKEMKRWAEAESALRFALQRFPGEPTIPQLLGEVLLEQGRTREAAPFFQQALRINPHMPAPYLGLGRVAMGEGDRGAAVRYLKLGLQRNPYDREALGLLQQLQQPPNIK